MSFRKVPCHCRFGQVPRIWPSRTRNRAAWHRYRVAIRPGGYQGWRWNLLDLHIVGDRQNRYMVPWSALQGNFLTHSCSRKAKSIPSTFSQSKGPCTKWKEGALSADPTSPWSTTGRCGTPTVSTRAASFPPTVRRGRKCGSSSR